MYSLKTLFLRECMYQIWTLEVALDHHIVWDASLRGPLSRHQPDRIVCVAQKTSIFGGGGYRVKLWTTARCFVDETLYFFR